jgi:hypothetical protein
MVALDLLMYGLYQIFVEYNNKEGRMHQSMQRLGLCLLFEKKLKQAVHWL